MLRLKSSSDLQSKDWDLSSAACDGTSGRGRMDEELKEGGDLHRSEVKDERRGRMRGRTTDTEEADGNAS